MTVLGQQGVRVLIGEEREVWSDLRQGAIMHSGKELANFKP
jgi:hypothetical protein